MIAKLLCFLGFHKPDLGNKIQIPCPYEKPTKEDYYFTYYKTQCTRCNAEMLGKVW